MNVVGPFVPKKSPCNNPDVFAPKASGPVIFPESLVYIPTRLKFGVALISFPSLSKLTGKGAKYIPPSPLAVDTCLVLNTASFLINPENLIPNFFSSSYACIKTGIKIKIANKIIKCVFIVI